MNREALRTLHSHWKGDVTMKEKKIGARLCELRKRNAYTQKELAARLGVHITTVKNWECGSCYPDAKNICALAELYHVSADTLLGREHADYIPLNGLTEQERKQIICIVQAYMDYLPRTALKR